jgi:acyl-CoA synthetase (AMP-forming)/AMP-acid ligase II
MSYSPFPGLSSDHYGVPFTEFITKDWTDANGDLRDKVAMTDALTGQSRTFRDYYNDTGSIAAHLHDLGITQDSTIALFSPNHVDYVPICLAAALCGAKLTPINPMYKVEELQTVLSRSDSDVLIVHSAIMEVAMEAIKGTGVKHIITIPEEDGAPVPYGTMSVSDLKDHSRPIFETHRSVHNNTANHPFLLPYSSGTTGMPKGVSLSHSNLISNLLQLETIEAIAFPSNQKLISPLPFFHIYGFLVSALYAVWQGQEVITMARYDLNKFCQAVEKYQPNRAHLVPPIIIQLAKNPIVDNYDLSSLNMIVSAAAPLSKETEQDLLDRIGCPVKQAWGMSELSPIATFTSDFNIRSGSVGQLTSDTFGKIVDSTGKSLGPGETGELMIQGPQVMMGYLNDPEKTAECLSEDGWLQTGDVAKYDNDGFFFITDRIKELIKVRGYPVAPAELEALLLTHPKLSDAAVIPVPDEMSGELPRAYVSLKEGVAQDDVTEDDIKEFVKEKVAPFKRLEGGVKFIDQVPKSASGKILRRVLVDQVKAERG